jgi:hypothetical protein
LSVGECSTKHLSVFEEIVFKFKKEDGFTPLNSPYAEMAP